MIAHETELLAAAKLTPGRFRGRAELTRSADSGDLVALGKLCERLGVPAPERNWARNEVWRRAHYAPRPTREEYLAARYAVDIRRLRAARAADREGIPAPAKPGRIARMARERRQKRERARLLPLIEAARREAGLRTATHGHGDRIVFVAPGHERAESSSDVVSSEAAGMGRAYCRVAHTVTQSEHVWHLPEGAEPYARDGYVYLSESVRVRRGRGTHLVTERLVTGRGGRLVWRRS